MPPQLARPSQNTPLVNYVHLSDAASVAGLHALVANMTKYNPQPCLQHVSKPGTATTPQGPDVGPVLKSLAAQQLGFATRAPTTVGCIGTAPLPTKRLAAKRKMQQSHKLFNTHHMSLYIAKQHTPTWSQPQRTLQVHLAALELHMRQPIRHAIQFYHCCWMVYVLLACAWTQHPQALINPQLPVTLWC